MTNDLHEILVHNASLMENARPDDTPQRMLSELQAQTAQHAASLAELKSQTEQQGSVLAELKTQTADNRRSSATANTWAKASFIVAVAALIVAILSVFLSVLLR